MANKEEEIWNIFTNLLNARVEKIGDKNALSQFFIKIPGLLKKFPTILISKKSDSDLIIQKRKRFALWLIHKLLWIRAQKLLSNDTEEAQKSCQKNIAFILKITGLQDYTLFCFIVEKCLILLHELNQATDVLYIGKSNF